MRLLGSFTTRILRWHAERVECVQVTPCWKNIGIADQVTAGNRRRVSASQGVKKRRELAILRQCRFDLRFCRIVHSFNTAEVLSLLFVRQLLSNHMQTVWNQSVFGIE